MTAVDQEDPLTEIERVIFDVICDHVDDGGYPPSVREIAERVGLESTSSVHHQLNNLVRKGLIARAPNRSRAITILRKRAAT
jgi:repressor LexA